MSTTSSHVFVNDMESSPSADHMTEKPPKGAVFLGRFYYSLL